MKKQRAVKKIKRAVSRKVTKKPHRKKHHTRDFHISPKQHHETTRHHDVNTNRAHQISTTPEDFLVYKNKGSYAHFGNMLEHEGRPEDARLAYKLHAERIEKIISSNYPVYRTDSSKEAAYMEAAKYYKKAGDFYSIKRAEEIERDIVLSHRFRINKNTAFAAVAAIALTLGLLYTLPGGDTGMMVSPSWIGTYTWIIGFAIVVILVLSYSLIKKHKIHMEIIENPPAIH